MITANRPGVGVLVIVIKDGKVLLGKRKNSLEAGAWLFPGGHLEFGETLQECAARELAEETGLAMIGDAQIVALTNNVFEKEDKHYVFIMMRAQQVIGTPHLREPEKCEQWGWFSWDDLPTPLCSPIKSLLEQGFNI